MKEHWPKIAVGVAAIALSYAAYRSMASEAIKEDTNKISRVKGNDGKEWPVPRKILSEGMSYHIQK